MKTALRYGVAAVGGALVVGLPWWALNDMRVGDLGRQPWPLSSGISYASAGGACGMLIVLVLDRRDRRRTRQLASIARTLGLQFHADVAQSDLDDFKALRVIRKWWAGRNRLSGVVDGGSVEMLDYTYRFVLRGAGPNAVRSAQTMVLLTTDVSLPTFDLRPRDRALGLLGEPDRIGIERLESYYLAPASQLDVMRDATPAGDPAMIRRLFTRDVVAFFAEHPGWHVESAGGRLAVWRDLKIVPPHECLFLLGDAVAFRRLLLSGSR